MEQLSCSCSLHLMAIKNLLIVAGTCVVLAGCNAGASARGGVDQVGSGLGGALQAPLEDFNLVREEIPEVLLQAKANPYDDRNLSRCTAINAEIARLDEALGPDSDAPPSEDGSYRSEQAADAAAGATLDAVRDTVTDFIPARSWIRRLTGAHQHSQEVQSSIRAGEQRRGFLKGMARQKGC